MNKIFIFLIKTYRIFATPLFNALGLKSTCRFYPTCSNYAEEMILKYGTLKGGTLALKRILSCNPWQKE